MSSEKSLTHITIPDEILKIAKVNFKKTVYIFANDYDVLLTNKKSAYFGYGLYGTIVLDNHNSFDLPLNLYSTICNKQILQQNVKAYKIYESDGNIHIRPINYETQITKNIKLHLPQEVLNVCKLNFKKNVYLCYDPNCIGKRIFLSNTKKSSYCYGIIELDNENNITLTPNMFKVLEVKTTEKITFYSSGNTLEFQYKRDFN